MATDTVNPRRSRAADLSGRRFGNLTAIAHTHTANEYAIWQCCCDCGAIVSVSSKYLVSLKTRSCGCVKDRRASRPGREYSIWTDLRNRCNNPNNRRFERYGRRGIRVCERWNTFATFLSDMGPCPPGMSIERINNDGDYEPQNCRWATPREQSRNNSRNRLLTFRGQTKCLADWGISTGISSDAIYTRLKAGWTIEEALTVGHRGMRHKWK